MPTGGSDRVLTRAGDAMIVTLVDGSGPALVILPSYGRDGGADFDDFAERAAREGWRVLRPQPRGVSGSAGPMENVTLHDLAGDVASVLRALGGGPVVLVGHAFGNLIARLVTTDNPDLVTSVALVASQAREVPERIAQAPFVAGDLVRPEGERLAALEEAFFAPGHDARVWLDGWYPATLAMQRAALETVPPEEYWACGAVPLLEVIPDHDAFNPPRHRTEMRDRLGARVTTALIADAGHALFPEQPEAAAEVILSWASRVR